jgi:hypothetical protein
LGPSVFAGLGVMLCMMIPLNAIMARKVKTVQGQLMKIRDMRVKITNETVQAMKIIKLYAWEKSFGMFHFHLLISIYHIISCIIKQMTLMSLSHSLIHCAWYG